MQPSTYRQPPSASEIAMGRLGAMAQELVALATQRFDRDDLADRGLCRSLIRDVRRGLDDLEERLALQPVELADDRRTKRARHP
jgi:hypothetical protein